MTDERIQDQLPALNTQGETVVRGHVRRLKPAGERAKRVKPYPSKWGRGKTYAFDDARVFITAAGKSLRWRIVTAWLILRGGGIRFDGTLVVLAAKGVRPVVQPTSHIPSDDPDTIMGPRDERR